RAAVATANRAVRCDWHVGPIKERPSTGARRSFEFTVPISPGRRHCTLGVLWNAPKHTFTGQVVNRDGAVIAAGAGRRRVSGKYPYSFWEIDNPKAGKWT